MVKGILNLVNKEIRGLHEAAYLLGIFAFLSQLLALVRDKLLAYYFGAGATLDLYYAAFRIPDLIFVTIASVVSASVLVPFFIEKIEGDFEKGKRFINHVFSVFFVSIVVVSIVAYIFMPQLITVFLPGFVNDPSLSELILATRILLLSPIFLGLSNFFASITQMYNRFLLYAISPLFYNLGIIVGAAWLYPHFGLKGLVVGVVLGAIMHCVIQIPFVSSKGLVPRFTLSIDWKSLGNVIRLSLPRTLTLSANQLAVFFLTALASLMVKGSISIFNFAWNLQSVPLTIIGVSYSSAAFPTLARLYTAGDHKKFVEHMISSARHIIFWSIIITVFFVVLRAQIVRVILGAGQFDWSDTRLTAAAFALFSISAVGQSLILLFVRAYYSQGATRKPLIVNLISSSLIVIMGYVFTKLFYAFPVIQYFIESLFRVESQEGSSVLVLALAYTLGVILNTILHWWLFHKDFKEFSKPVITTFFQSLSASVIMGYVTYLALRPLSIIFPLTTVVNVFLQGFFAGVVGLATCILVLWLLKSEELAVIWRTLHARIWRAKVVAPEQEIL